MTTNRQRQIDHYIRYVQYLLTLDNFTGLPCALHYHTWNNRIGNLVFTRWITYTNISPRIQDTLLRVPRPIVDGRREQSEFRSQQDQRNVFNEDASRALSRIDFPSDSNELADIVSRTALHTVVPPCNRYLEELELIGNEYD